MLICPSSRAHSWPRPPKGRPARPRVWVRGALGRGAAESAGRCGPSLALGCEEQETGGWCVFGEGWCQLRETPLRSPRRHPVPKAPGGSRWACALTATPVGPSALPSHLLQEVRQGFPSLEKRPVDNAVRCLWLTRVPAALSSLRHHKVSLAPS